MADYVILVILLVGTVFFIPGAWSHVAPALRTGVLQARGRVYERDKQPVRFWLGIVFWLGMSMLFVVMLVFYSLGLMRQHGW
jgi:hypothetical protein